MINMSWEDAFYLQVKLKDQQLLRSIVQHDCREDVVDALKMLVSDRALQQYNMWMLAEQDFLNSVSANLCRTTIISMLRESGDKQIRDDKIRRWIGDIAWTKYERLQYMGITSAHPDLFLDELNVVLRKIARPLFIHMDVFNQNGQSSLILLEKIASLEGEDASNEFQRWKAAPYRKNTLIPCSFDFSVLTSTSIENSGSVCLYCLPVPPLAVQMKNASKPILLHDALKSMEKNTNILVLGESGVGKSTFINAFVNYLEYDSLESAIANGAKIMIGTKFSVTDVNYDVTEVVAHSKNGMDNEVLELGQSCTQDPRSYCLELSGQTITLIDTPGMGDHRGIEQDEKHFEKILSVIGQYQEIHAICILLKPNISKMTIGFRFCIDKLLESIPMSARKNILFCFTNSRGTFYRPGDTLPTLRTHLEDKQRIGSAPIKLEREALFCFDSEAFRHLCARMQSDQLFDEDDFINAQKSWTYSANETARLLARIAELKPYCPTRSTTTVDITEQERLAWLARPLAEITRNIVLNIRIIKEWRKRKVKKNKDGSRIIHLVNIAFYADANPRIICASEKCSSYEKFSEDPYSQRRVHNKVCKGDSKMIVLQYGAYLPESLQTIDLFNKQGICTECHCSLSSHFSTRYTIQEYGVKQNIVKSSQTFISQKYAPDPSNLLNDYKGMRRRVLELCRRLNSLCPYDEVKQSFSFAFQSHIGFLLTEEAQTAFQSKRKDVFDSLSNLHKDLKMEYFTIPSQTMSIIADLKNLPDYGRVIKAVLEFEECQRNSTGKFATEFVQLSH